MLSITIMILAMSIINFVEVMNDHQQKSVLCFFLLIRNNKWLIKQDRNSLDRRFLWISANTQRQNHKSQQCHTTVIVTISTTRQHAESAHLRCFTPQTCWYITIKLLLIYYWCYTGIYRAVKCRLIGYFRGQALLLRVLHAVACDNVRDCVFLKDDLNRVKKGLNSYELNFSLPTNSQNKLTELN